MLAGIISSSIADLLSATSRSDRRSQPVGISRLEPVGRDRLLAWSEITGENHPRFVSRRLKLQSVATGQEVENQVHSPVILLLIIRANRQKTGARSWPAAALRLSRTTPWRAPGRWPKTTPRAAPSLIFS
jgi:hypothetical protein